MTGSVKVQGTGEPVKGGRFSVFLGDSTSTHPDRLKDLMSGEDGRFSVDLPPGQIRAWTFFAPVGFWAPGNGNSQETFVLTPEHPVHSKEYLVRRGVIWTFQIDKEVDRKPFRTASVGAHSKDELFMTQADEAGRALLTLPSEGQKLTIYASPDSASMQSTLISIEWNTDFRPGAVKTMEHRPGRVVVIDDTGKEATIMDSAGVQATITDSKLVVHVKLPEASQTLLGNLSGRVIDGKGQPLANAKVALAFGDSRGSAMSGDPAHQVTTNAHGDYNIPSIPRRNLDGKPMKVFVVVTKDGYAGTDSRSITIPPADDKTPPALEPIQIKPGATISGTVFDLEGRPAVGVWVEIRGSYAAPRAVHADGREGAFPR